MSGRLPSQASVIILWIKGHQPIRLNSICLPNASDESPPGSGHQRRMGSGSPLFQDIFPTDDDADLRKRQEEIVKILRKVARDVIGKDDFKLIFRDKHGFNINWDGFYLP
ncbi:hypothetical protein B0H14DRAFT_2618349 [Mycena olivaceomarginata]|nr:hypothetical protein B0H14DRAFT_2618349 [Mycena olivaceomarginata]